MSDDPQDKLGPNGKPWCPEKCGVEMEVIVEPPYQEYPGACPVSGAAYWQCPKCGAQGDTIERIHMDPDNIRENTRGW